MESEYRSESSPVARKWKEIIRPETNPFDLHLKDLWEYRDLLLILTKRDITAIYKQTILGPLWFFVQPALMSLVYILIFSKAGKISTDGIPPILFYLSGLVLWIFFSECTLKTSGFARDNSAILTKVYFPRLIIPLSIVLTNLVKLAIQMGLFLLIYLFYIVIYPDVRPAQSVWLIPVLILITGMLGLGTGIIVTSLTTRYKDLTHLITFAIQLLMFASTVIFPLGSIDNHWAKNIIRFNPMSGIIEAFRYCCFGKGQMDYVLLSYDFGLTVILLITGVLLFNRAEKHLVDTI